MYESAAKTIEFSEALNSLNKAVAKKGEDYVYRSGRCRYFEDDGGPSCLVGWVLADKGVTKADLDARGNVNSEGLDSLFRSGLVEADDRTRRLLSEAQAANDGRTAWGRAMDAILSLFKKG
jgi:hypothetical protein